MSDKKQIPLEIRADIARGTYSNLAIITHSSSEFVVDFATLLPGIEKPDITNRIILTPEHAKRLLNALQDNIIKYETQFGVIDLEPNRGPQGGGTFNLADFGNNGTKGGN